MRGSYTKATQEIQKVVESLDIDKPFIIIQANSDDTVTTAFNCISNEDAYMLLHKAAFKCLRREFS